MDAPKPPQPVPPPPVASRFILPPRTRYQFPFPNTLERRFSSFDDSLVALCQRRTDGLIHFLSVSLTFFTSIEVSLIAPPTLYALGYDAAAGLSSSVLLVLGIVSQVPKKFIYRPRPWMVGRALPIRQDKTSSFPSRAVVCAVVFSWLIAQSLAIEGILNPPSSPALLWIGILCVAALTAFARINVGAHYPSDTLLGFVLGCCVVRMGMRVESWWRVRCVLDSVPTNPSKVLLSTWSQLLRWTSYQRLFGVTIIAYLMTLISIQGFWVKCSYVYGLLMSSAAFRATYACDRNPGIVRRFGHVRPVLDHGSLREHIYATSIFASLLIFGMLTRGRKGPLRIVTFSLIYAGTLIALVSWRL